VAEVFPAASAGEVSAVDGVAPLVSVAVDVEDALAGALVVSVPGSRIEPAMRAAGAESVRLSVCLPVVPGDLAANPPTDGTDAGSCEVFVPDALEPLPNVEFTLHPEPWRWIVGLLLVVASLILAIVGLVRRLRAAAVGSLGLLAVAAATGLGSQVDATLAGLSSSSVVAVASSLARWTGLAAASVAVVALGRLRPVKTAPDEPTRPAVPVH